MQRRPMASSMKPSSLAPKSFCRLARVWRNWTCLFVAGSPVCGLASRWPLGSRGGIGRRGRDGRWNVRCGTGRVSASREAMAASDWCRIDLLAQGLFGEVE